MSYSVYCSFRLTLKFTIKSQYSSCVLIRVKVSGVEGIDVRGVEMEGVVLLQDSREVRLGEVMGLPCMSFSHRFSSLCKYCWNNMDEIVKDTSACIKLCGQSVAMAYMNITTKLWLLSLFFFFFF